MPFNTGINIDSTMSDVIELYNPHIITFANCPTYKNLLTSGTLTITSIQILLVEQE